VRTIGIEVDDSKRGPAPKKQRLYRLTASQDRRCAAASLASPGNEKGPLTSEDIGDASATPLASPLGRVGDAGNAGGDAALFAASPLDCASDLRERTSGDARNAGDAGMRQLSDVVCDVCGLELTPIDGSTTHPTC